MSNIEEIEKYIEKYTKKRKMCDLADNMPQIHSEIEAYSFDDIAKKIAKNKIASADVIYINRWINLIEFKTGFSNFKDNFRDKLKRENQKLNIKLKMMESYEFLDKVILSECKDFACGKEIRKRFISVIDTEENPIEATLDVLAEVSGEYAQQEMTLKREIHDFLRVTIANFGKEIQGKHLFYDCVDVWYDTEFDIKIETIS